tara:strand:+ start:36 stop:599 length:564 start_codon:yes stop_codon:yes gene_type:complete
MSFLGFGGGSESNIIIPEGEKPKAFQTVIPQKSYKDLAESMGRTETEYNRLLDTRYDMTGTGAQIGAKQRGIELQEAASYASSLPKYETPDTSFRGTPREFDIKSKGNTFETVAGQTPKAGSAAATTTTATPKKTLAREAAEMRQKDAKDYYLASVELAKKTPRSYMEPTKDPGFAQNDPSIYLPKN